MATFTLATADSLKAALEQQEDVLTANHATRLHRAISWLKSAEQAQSIDIEFISLWISFSACFSVDDLGDETLEAHASFQQFIELIVNNDSDNKIYSCLWEEYSGHVKSLVKNPFVFHPFWVAQRNGTNFWQEEFDQSSIKALNALSRKRVPELCSIVLDRLFVLRNQIIHGGATFEGRVNREQVRDGAGLLGTLMPLFIEIMLTANDEAWGDVRYPVINRH
ncbi:hypothetical protein [Reinekea sp.]|jgi:hypothetical protein|uniref:hypothetical protein n=1 Tax=Reinekea sp. TaxID=1970455 RepID=UPI00398A0171